MLKETDGNGALDGDGTWWHVTARDGTWCHMLTGLGIRFWCLVHRGSIYKPWTSYRVQECPMYHVWYSHSWLVRQQPWLQNLIEHRIKSTCSLLFLFPWNTYISWYTLHFQTHPNSNQDLASMCFTRFCAILVVATPQRHGLPRGRHAAWGAGRFAWWLGHGPWSPRQHLGESHGYQQLVWIIWGLCKYVQGCTLRIFEILWVCFDFRLTCCGNAGIAFHPSKIEMLGLKL